jgi:hypothetical protein
MNNATKKLQKLVKNRKTQVVVIKRGSVKYNNRSNSSTSSESYYSESTSDNN